METLTPETLVLGLSWYVVFLFSLTLHEAAHAWAALRLGDSTAYEGGQVSLNPWPHLRREPFGTVLVPMLSYALMGWMMGWASAPYDPVWARRYPRRAGWMALAGPVSNLLLATGAFVALKVGLVTGTFGLPEPGTSVFEGLVSAPAGAWEGVAMVLSLTFVLNLLLFLFNLLPLPPLDGSAILQLVLPAGVAARYQEFLAQPMFALLGLILAWRFFGYIFWPILIFAQGLLYF